MKGKDVALLACLFSFLSAGTALASERLFTYTYEPETMPQGGREFEQSVTLRTPRNSSAGQDQFVRWDFTQELEFGVNDAYTLALLWNEKVERFEDSQTKEEIRESEFKGFGLENKIMIWNPADHKVGLSFYIEPHISQDEFELEEKIILGQRFGDWKWALNITHETEWEEDFKEAEGILEFSAGITRELDKHWFLGVEFRNHNELPDYETWEHTAFFLGPVLTHKGENWWLTLTVLGQVYGKNYGEDIDGEPNVVLDEHEYLNIRCILGIDF